MKNLTLLPADQYIVVNKTVFYEEDRRLLTMLYQPIIGYSAVSLYLSLIDDLENEWGFKSSSLNGNDAVTIRRYSYSKRKVRSSRIIKNIHEKRKC